MRRKAFVLRLLTLAPLVCLIVIALIHCQPGAEHQPGSLFIKEGEYRGQYWPTAGWRTCGPGAVGMDSNRLMKVYEYAASPEFYTDGLAIVHKGYIVAEVYLGEYSMTIPHEGFSVTKSFTSALVGSAVDKGLLQGVHEKVYGFSPRWQVPGTPGAKKRITIRHLLTLTSGLEWNEDLSNNENDHQRMVQSHDYLEYVLSRPVAVEPGTRWNYSSGDCMLLSGIIREVSGISAYEFAGENLFTPLGIQHVVWRSDPAGQTVGGSQLGATVREFAKFGYLYLKKGQYNNM